MCSVSFRDVNLTAPPITFQIFSLAICRLCELIREFVWIILFFSYFYVPFEAVNSYVYSIDVERLRLGWRFGNLLPAALLCLQEHTLY